MSECNICREPVSLQVTRFWMHTLHMTMVSWPAGAAGGK